MDYSKIASQQSIDATVLALKGKGYEVITLSSRAEALEHLKTLVPRDASVMNGSSRTLEEIGFVEYLKSGKHGWNNLHAAVLAEKDPVKQARLRKEAVLSDYYLGSVHALVADGTFIVASNTASQLPHVVYTSPHLIFVVGAQKLVPSLDAAVDRLKTYVIPLEDKHMQQRFGVGTTLNKMVTFFGESAYNKRTITFLIVKEKLGF